MYLFDMTFMRHFLAPCLRVKLFLIHVVHILYLSELEHTIT